MASVQKGVIISAMADNTIIDPRQAQCLVFYQDPKSDTFGNLYQSALRAGFLDAYARNISERKPNWLTENVVDTVKMVKRAERNLKKYLEVSVDLTDKSKGNIDVAKLQADVSKFILKTLARKKYSEVEEGNAPSVTVNIIEYGNKSKVIDAVVDEGNAPSVVIVEQGAKPINPSA